MVNLKKILFIVIVLVILFSSQIADAQGSKLIPLSASPSEELIDAINTLRRANGLSTLEVHPVLMQIAQIEVEGIAAGMAGHWRPNNITLGQWLLSLGYPLAGDLSLDGYRSENWVTGVDLTVQGAVEMWKGDEPHLNTMLSSYRSDIGAGVATSVDEYGQTIFTYVLETALQTTSGRIPGDAYPTLTALAFKQITGYGDATQAAQSLLVSQFIMPVVRATARPDGDVIHEVKNGQSLWSIATVYGVKIDQIRSLNNLASSNVYTGEKLLVLKGATQPAPTATTTVTPSSSFMPPTTNPARSSTPQPSEQVPVPDQKASTFRFGAIVIVVLVLGAAFTLMISKKK